MTWLQTCSRYMPVQQSGSVAGTAESMHHLGFHCNRDWVCFMGRGLGFLLLLTQRSGESDARVLLRMKPPSCIYVMWCPVVLARRKGMGMEGRRRSTYGGEA